MHKAKYQLLIHKRGSAGIKHFKDSEAFIEYSNDMDDIYQNIEECNPTKKTKNIDRIDRIDCWHVY